MRHALACTLLLAGCAVTPASPDPDARSLAEAERAFAAQSMRSDMASAFLANFSDDGMMVTARGWTRAKAALAGRPAPPIDLDWAPSHVEVSASGELGLSTGPWIRKSRGQREAPPAHGHFVSVWRRSPEGRWQVEVDLGIPHAEAFAKPAQAYAMPPAAVASTGESIERMEAAFAQACAHEGTAAAFARHALPRLMLYREGHAPIHGRQAAHASGLLDASRIAYRAEALVASRANDFAYSRGTYAAAEQPDKVLGYFLRIWRREGERWGIVLDVANGAR